MHQSMVDGNLEPLTLEHVDVPSSRSARRAPFEKRLRALERRNLRRQLTPVSQGTEPWVEIDGRRLLNLSSNNYLGLATHPAVVAEVKAAADAYGCGAGSARLIAGSNALCQRLEQRLASFKGTESALLYTSGYVANLGLIPSLVGPGDLVVGDELNHASLIDGCRLSRAAFCSVPHRDVAAIERELAGADRRGHRGRRLVVTDTVFSMDGDLAPLAEITAVCDRFDALLMVDEAHATGCLGPDGRGLAAAIGVEKRVDVSMGTLSKAFGSLGAFAACDGSIRDYLVNVSRSFMFTTALPPTVIAASLAALDVLACEAWRPEQLRENALALRRGLQQMGFDTLGSETHIVPILVGDAAAALALADALREEGVFVVAVRPPTVPAGSARIRASVMASHTPTDVAAALDAFRRAAERIGKWLGAGR